MNEENHTLRLLSGYPDIDQDINIRLFGWKQVYQNQNQQIRYFAADFEATTLEPAIVYMVTVREIMKCPEPSNPIESKLIGWTNGYAVSNNHWEFTSVKQYLRWLDTMQNTVTWFHNGHNYDFHFLKDFCLRPQNKSHYTYRDGNVVGITTIHERKMTSYKDKYSYRTDKQGNKMINHIKHSHRFIDSIGILKGSLKALGKSIGIEKIDNTPLIASIHKDATYTIKSIYSNKIIKQNDENVHPKELPIQLRPIQSNFWVDCYTKGWWEYAIQDTFVLAHIVVQKSLIDYFENRRVTTAAALAWNDLIKDTRYEDKIAEIHTLMKKSKSYSDKIKLLMDLYRPLYKGGLVYCNPKYLYKDYGEIRDTNGFHLDYTSAYPSVYSNPEKYPLPQLEFTNEKTNLYMITYFNIKAKVKPDRVPLIKLKTDTENNPNDDTLKVRNTYYDKEFYLERLSITSVEDAYFKENYEFTFKNAKILYFKEDKELEQAFKDFGARHYQTKVECDELLKTNLSESERLSVLSIRNTAKLFLNSPYGYMGFYDKEYANKSYYYNPELDLIDYDIDSNNPMHVGRKFSEMIAAAFVTAYVRVKLANDINKVGLEHFVYCDTDSMFVVGLTEQELRDRLNISDQLGDFKIEHRFNRMRLLGNKTYAIADTTDEIIACATAGSNYQFKDINDFENNVYVLSTQKVVVSGGVIIQERWKQIAPTI